MKKIAAFGMILLLCMCAGVCLAEEKEIPTYADYLELHAQDARPSAEIEITPQQMIAGEGNHGAYIDPGDTYGVSGALIWASGVGEVSFSFHAEQAGMYELHMSYLPLPARQMNPELSFSLDGECPFDRAGSVLLSRTYAPAGGIGRDSRGHDIRPKLAEIHAWQETAFSDTKSYYQDPYLIYVSEGDHTLTLSMIAEAIAIEKITLTNPESIPSYDEYTSGGITQDASLSPFTIQAEQASRMSSQTLYPLSERASAATQPSDPVKTRMNTIGGANWKTQGDWLEWDIDVPQTGWYYMTMRCMQDFSRGLTSMRELTIDGKVPFAQAQNIAIPYRVNWQMATLGGDAPQALYLEKGRHTLRLTARGSEHATTLRRTMEVVSSMNALYRNIVTITGSNADANRVTIDLNRDFQLEKKIPGFIGQLSTMARALREEEAAIAARAGSGSEAAILVQTASQMESFCKKPETVPSRMEAFKDNSSSLSSWALQIGQQPLQLDYITFTPVGQPLPTGKVSIFEQISFRVRAFLGSFTEDYNAVGEVYEQDGGENITLTVWVCANDLGSTGIASGRDQTQLIKELIDQNFVPQTGINVNLSLIDGSSTLMQATLGNKGPDVAMTVYKELPVNLAMRGALADLSQMEGYDEAISRFYPSALIPYEYQGGVYALPETQNFYMIFYRRDMFEEMGLTVPETWEDMRALIPVLTTMGMRAAVPEPTVTNNNTLGFQIFLFQHGLNYYTEDLSRTLFDKPEALEAFTEWTDLYTRYSMPVKYDFFSRFRTGEIPIALDHYTMANTLAAAAPELDGLWEIAPIPGVQRADGTIDRSEGAMGTGAVVMAASRHQQAAFDFISWWTSDETQTTFGLSLENLMGAAARWPTANKNAFLQMRWTKAQQKAILDQWEDVDDIPQLPGNYIINRNLAFAFRAVVYDDKIPREILAKYNKEINKEIQRKWAEFKPGEAMQ